MNRPAELYHYTCSHYVGKIGARGVLLGQVNAILIGYGRLVWLADLDVPMARALGVPTSPCDRTQFRVAVAGDLAEVAHWPRWSRRQVPVQLRQAFETNDPGAMHNHWWVGFGDLPILRIDDMKQPFERTG